MTDIVNIRVRDAVDDILSNLRHEFDIRAADALPDSPQWADISRRLHDLVIAAYTRNHDGQPA